MASIFKSSIGKKLIMSISGLFLILFLTFHMVMNLTYVFDPESKVYGTICEILSMGWVNVVVPILAAGFLVHITYAFSLTIGNRKARGEQRYASSSCTCRSSGPRCSCRTGSAPKRPTRIC